MSQRFETFSFLPPLSTAQVQAQIDDMLARGWVPMVDFAENPNCADFYWREWPQILLHKQSPVGKMEGISTTAVVTQIESCSRRHPYAFVRLSAYDPKTRMTKQSFIVKTPVEGV